MSELTIKERALDDQAGEAGDVVVLSLGGVLDKVTCPELEARMKTLVEAGKARFVVECSGLAHLSNEGMRVFLSQLIKLRKADGDIKFCNMSPDVKSVLSVLRLGKLLTVSETLDEAVADFAKASAAPPRRSPASQKLRIEIEDVGSDVSVCGLFGFVDRHTINQLDEALSDLLARKRARIVIDCAELTYISSNGMGVFISYVSKARNQGGDIRLCNLRDVARTVITMLGLHRHFEVFEEREAALASYT